MRVGVGRRTASRLSLLVVAAALVVAGCTSSPSDPGASGQGGAPEAPAPPPKPVQLVLSPSQGAAEVGPGEPVTVAATDGKVTEVKLTNAEGKVVAGQVKPDGTGWQATEPLGYGKSYTLNATGVGTDGKPATSTSTFTTVAKPAKQTTVSINAQDGETVGVGMPLVFTFGMKIPDKAAAEKALQITAEPATEGAFHWFSDQSVTWRPKDYWRSGTKVSVKAAVYGKNLGNGIYGKEDRTANITIGDKLVAVADGATFRMKVQVNDQQVQDFPISMGKKSSSTPNGTYTVMSEHNGYTMDSSTYGVPTDSAAGYRTFVKYAVRMSNSGIFYHSAPWSVGSQGKRNVSHGCINLSTENAKWMMDNSKKGDIITVQNGGSQTLEASDGWSVWQMSWDEWKAGGKKN
ncbi:L,D-transpeptidase [Amycolatopsis suaedae]|uniref:L,D-TPase catalytic domain-containing protein n=1 Tax=Amycolatopsis suaedae TaxID=2510978 RepID=A0A4Q7IYL3_9PSEU|nr:Ig-like domain-containing protein [Amycolatopsis suaedae]RZQ59539.1 hypothetical protein EWH70_33670 [Amycolatopsis suaedae]